VNLPGNTITYFCCMITIKKLFFGSKTYSFFIFFVSQLIAFLSVRVTLIRQCLLFVAELIVYIGC